MKNFLLSLLVLSVSSASFAQNLDLIVTVNNDSIACKIDSITSEKIFLTGRLNGVQLHTFLPKSKILEYTLNHVSKRDISYIPGTLFFQTKPEQLLNANKHNIYGSLGFFGLYVVLQGTYETLLYSKPNSGVKTTWIRMSGAYYGTWGMAGPQFTVQGVGLTGSKNRHLEFSLGIALIFDNWDWSAIIIPAAGIGYRYQKPNKPFLFRTGFAVPESAYISLGFSF